MIVIASLASTLVSYFSTTWTTADGIHLSSPIIPNYAFTQVNPLPFEVPNLIPLGGVMQYINLFYVLLVYIAYVCLFFTFYGLYRAYLGVYGAISAKKTAVTVQGLAEAEAAATDEEQTNN